MEHSYFVGHQKDVLCLEINEEETILCSGSEDSTVRLWDIRNSKCIRALTGFQSNEVNSVVFHRLGCATSQTFYNLYAAAGSIIYCFDLRRPEIVLNQFKSFQFNTDEINQLTFSGNYIASCDDSGEIKILQIHSSRSNGLKKEENTVENELSLFKTLRRVHKQICSSVKFRPQHPSQIVSGSFDSTLVLWDFVRLKPLFSFDMHSIFGRDNSVQVVNPPFVNSIDVSCDGTKTAVGLGNCSVVVFDLNKRKALHSMDAHRAAVSQVIFPSFSSHNGLISSSNDCSIILWYTSSDNELASERTRSSRGDKLETSTITSMYSMSLKIDHQEKINWLTTSSKGDLFVADNTCKISVYSIRNY